jgi:hypothetical protein
VIWSLALVGPVREPEAVEHHLHLVASCAQGLCFAVVDSKVLVVPGDDAARAEILCQRQALLAALTAVGPAREACAREHPLNVVSSPGRRMRNAVVDPEINVVPTRGPAGEPILGEGRALERCVLSVGQEQRQA